MAAMTKKQQERKKFWMRAMCAFLAFLMVASAVFAIFEIF